RCSLCPPWLKNRCRLFGASDAEADVADAGVRQLGLQLVENLLFLEGEFLDDGGVADGNFQGAAVDAAGASVLSDRVAGGVLPGGGEVGVGLDAAVAAGGD